jgi:ribosomal protein S18 acetylase RimI-like enzyme
MTENNFRKTNLEEIEIYNASDDDIEFLSEVYYSTRFEEFSSFGWSEAQIRNLLEMQFNVQKQAYSFQFPEAESLIICKNKEKIGRIIINRTTTELRLVDISLLPQFRNFGIGTKLITDLSKEATDKKLPLSLRVAQNNQAAFRLYQKLGFQVTDENEMYISMKWQNF